MKQDFLFRLPGFDKLISLQELDDIIINKIRSDFKDMDAAIVEIYDTKSGIKAGHHTPPLTALGEMSVSAVMQKFR